MLSTQWSSSGQILTTSADTLEAMKINLLQPAGLVASPAFSHVAVVPAGATTIYVGGQNGVDDTGAVVSDDIAEQSIRAVDNAGIALEAAGAALSDVVQWTVLIDANADLRAAYGAIAPRLAGAQPPPLVTAALVAGLGVPGALIEVSAIAAVLPRSSSC
jgi:enamine deaminase RidA (YjgF/YER057c/UK114 family)